uniref:Uncharacterized protein n=1 Tax=Arundo donax TaxID=35708 RepID=A0A0A8ZE50_ARUDO
MRTEEKLAGIYGEENPNSSSYLVWNTIIIYFEKLFVCVALGRH